jgi:hypothetical protein
VYLNVWCLKVCLNIRCVKVCLNIRCVKMCLCEGVSEGFRLEY